MDKQTSLTPFELELKAILDVPEPDANFVQGLRGWLIQRGFYLRAQPAAPRKGAVPPRAALRLAFFAAIFLLVLAVFFAFGPERVLAGVRNWLGGFLPNAGFVEPARSLRVLEKPVQISVPGAAIAVEKGYTNAEETAIQIAYLDDSRACKNTSITNEQYRARLAETVYLLLPDGRKLYALTPRFASWGKFPPLPEGVNEAVLMVPPNVIVPCQAEKGSTFCQCMDDDLRWMILLKFVPPAPGSVLPVVDSSTPTPLPEPTATLPALPTSTAQPAAAAAQPPTPAGATETPVVTNAAAVPQPELLGKLVKMDDGYLILAILKRDLEGRAAFRFGLNEQPASLKDAAGSEIALETVERRDISPQVFEGIPPGDTIQYRVRSTSAAGPLKLTFPVLTVSQYLFGKEAEFEIDLGANPRQGQRIPLDVPLNFIPAHPFTLKSATIDSLDANTLGLTLTFAGKGYETIMVNPVTAPPDAPPQGGSSGQCEEFPGCFYTTSALPFTPGHAYRLVVSNVEHAVEGPWSIEFELK